MSMQHELDALVTAAVETGLNAVIKQTPSAKPSLYKLKGKVLKLHLKEPNKSLIFIFSQQVDVLANFEGEPDCYLGLSVSTLSLLRDKAKLTQLIKQDKLELDGDLAVAQAFAELLAKAKPDFEEWLSQYTGDIVAHTVFGAFKSLNKAVVGRAQKSQRHLALAVTEEWQLAPPPLEVAYFCDQVERTAKDAEVLEARLNALLNQHLVGVDK